MIFSLETLQGKHGDCLLLYYGKNDNPKVIVIDGGPAGVYRKFLKPRLLEVKESLSPDDPLPFSMVMVSHLDDDHINGILAMTEEIVDKQEANEAQEFTFKNIWCNTFDDIIGNIQIPKISSLPASVSAASVNAVPEIAGAEDHIAAVIVSTGQGRKLRDHANFLAASVNNPFKATGLGKANLVHDGEKTIKWDTGLNITVIHPNEQRLKELQKRWDKDLQVAKDKGDNSIIVASITSPDTSPFNLSSIVCLVEFKKKTILLTGDARSDHIVAGLKKNKLLDKKGKLHVDILKLPHHGSVRNMDADFFKVVSADHYVISADGRHENPDEGLLDIFAANVKTGTLHLTNRDGEFELGKKLDKFLKKIKKNGGGVEVNFREENGTIVIDLLDEIEF